jgi:hypothetical protein
LRVNSGPGIRCDQRPNETDSIVDELLDEGEAAGEVDLICDFAYPLPVIAELPGGPASDRAAPDAATGPIDSPGRFWRAGSSRELFSVYEGANIDMSSLRLRKKAGYSKEVPI